MRVALCGFVSDAQSALRFMRLARRAEGEYHLLVVTHPAGDAKAKSAIQAAAAAHRLKPTLAPLSGQAPANHVEAAMRGAEPILSIGDVAVCLSNHVCFAAPGAIRALGRYLELRSRAQC